MSGRFPTTVPAIGAAFARVRTLMFERTGNEAIDRAFDRIVAALRPVFASPWFDETTVKSVAFSAGVPTVVSHRLGRAWKQVRLHTFTGAGARWFVVAQTPTTLDAMQVTIQCDATCVADVGVC